MDAADVMDAVDAADNFFTTEDVFCNGRTAIALEISIDIDKIFENSGGR